LVQHNSSESVKNESMPLSVLMNNWNVSGLNKVRVLSLPVFEQADEPVRIKTTSLERTWNPDDPGSGCWLQLGDASISNASLEWYHQKSMGPKWF
jgi:hypothetical protein